MFTLITDNEEFKLNTVEEVVVKANEIAKANGCATTFDLEVEEENIYFGFTTLGYIPVTEVERWIEEEREVIK